jgi:hypothetical protein
MALYDLLHQQRHHQRCFKKHVFFYQNNIIFSLFQTYTYDPANPVPTIGGNTLFIACGALDQSPLNNRFVVLLFFVCLFV